MTPPMVPGGATDRSVPFGPPSTVLSTRAFAAFGHGFTVWPRFDVTVAVRGAGTVVCGDGTVVRGLPE